MYLQDLPPVDIQSFLQTATILLYIGMLVMIYRAIGMLRSGRDLTFYRLRRDRLIYGWRLFFIGIILGGAALMTQIYGEPTVYSLVEVTATQVPSATPSQTPTLTITPTITPTPTITLTPAESYTPSPSPTPHLPIAVEAQFSGLVTPPAEAVFSPLVFSRGIDSSFRLIREAEIFQNPIKEIYGSFSYNNMANGVQWTALWYREGELVYYETNPWDGDTGGLGFTDWSPGSEAWLPGNYKVIIFIGHVPIQVGSFLVQGEPFTRTPTPTITRTPTITPIFTPTFTRWPTLTRTPIVPSITPQQVNTWTPRPTWPPTLTPKPTFTRWPTLTNTPTP